MAGDEYTICHGEIGDDVEMLTAENLRADNSNNGIVHILINLTQPKSLIEGAETHYEWREIVLLIDSRDVESDIAF